MRRSVGEKRPPCGAAAAARVLAVVVKEVRVPVNCVEKQGGHLRLRLLQASRRCGGGQNSSLFKKSRLPPLLLRAYV